MTGGQDNMHGEDHAPVATENADNWETTRIHQAVPRMPQLADRQMTRLRLQRLTAATDNRPPAIHEG